MSVSMRGVRHSLLLAAGTIIATGANAQPTRPAGFSAGAVVQSIVPDGGAELRRHLTTLADDPRNLEALIGAGRAALRGGDTQAALSFFSRAGEVSYRDSRVKAGMASVLVRMERGQPALVLFAEALALGAPVWEIAGDRGLAHDMVGDPRRAQQDYALVLQRREDAEVRRRLALSLAISGEKDAALRVIDGQLRRNERAAWRAQAFILALTGDWAGANRTAHGMMTAAAAEAITPFLARLPNLTAAQKAMAVHFGRFPANGGTAAAGTRDIRADPGALALATGVPAPRQRSQVTDAADGATRRRPGTSQAAAPNTQTPARSSRTTRTRRSQAVQDAGLSPVQSARLGASSAGGPAPSVQSRRAEPAPSRTATNPPPTGVRFAPAISQPQTATPSTTIQASNERLSSTASTGVPAQGRNSLPAAVTVSAAADIMTPNEQQILSAQALPAASLRLPASRPPGQPSAGLSDISAVVADLSDDEAGRDRATSSSAATVTTAPPQSAGRTPVPSTRPASSPTGPSHPSRHWVQIAGGANAAALPRELARLRSQAPELTEQSAWVAPANATHRLLVGPFASASEARAFVNILARREVTSFAWTSTAGQEIARLQPGR